MVNQLKELMDRFVFLVIIIGVVSACQTNPCGMSKKQFISHLDAFVEDIDAQDLELRDEKWEAYDETFGIYMEECLPKYEEELTNREEKKIATLATEYYYLKYGKGTFEQFKEHGDELIIQIQDALDDFIEINENAVEKIIEKLDEEKIGDAIDRFSQWLDDIDIQIEIKTKDK